MKIPNLSVINHNYGDYDQNWSRKQRSTDAVSLETRHRIGSPKRIYPGTKKKIFDGHRRNRQQILSFLWQ
uniref:Uncharacterized protein n=1 Tax=Panagrolaimus sp. JU765 TaxID=591449 RepID=A0AC34QGD6_9BILA